tara:strand:- start:78 stop:1193 length:1116 start_codon:yes stop_codon:yes gene_type:complete
MRKKNLADLVESMNSVIDSIKEAAGDCALSPEEKELLIEQACEIHRLEADYRALDVFGEELSYSLAVASLSASLPPKKNNKQTKLIALIEGQGTKWCPKCEQEVPLGGWYRSPISMCKACEREIYRERRAANGKLYKPRNSKKPTVCKQEWCEECQMVHEVALVHMPSTDAFMKTSPEWALFFDEELGVRLTPSNRGYPFFHSQSERIVRLLRGKWTNASSIPRNASAYRLILNCSDGQVADHIDGDPLNNLPCNLRIVSIAQNNYNRKAQKNNTSGYKGVSAHRKKWCAYLNYDNKRFRPGIYKTKEHAAYAYDIASMILHGEYGVRNFKSYEPFYQKIIDEGLNPMNKKDRKVIIEKLEKLISHLENTK